ncbi:MAG: GerMN domain-containing protein [Myxococcaceae bacterium]|nr:GerMN domain-containing protein [Myxococcaceae bacterium]
MSMKQNGLALALIAMTSAACAHSPAPEPAPEAVYVAPAPAPTAAPEETMLARVYFLSEANLQAGVDPLLLSVDRVVSKVTPARGVLDAMFQGPTDAEYAQGLVFVSSGATGFQRLRVENGVAHVELTGGCSSAGSSVTIANLITATLKQFPSVMHVRIYDANGQTQNPNGPGDSIPACLMP